MPRIVEELYYDGARERVVRLGITALIDEVKAIVTGFLLQVKESADSNGGARRQKTDRCAL